MNDFFECYARQSHKSAKNVHGARWYASYGAVPLSGRPLTLVMALASFAANLKAAGQL